ncbi:MAG: 45 protein [Thermoproteota archaeon]|nr:45 protein [Thermoproteota archaeon]
MVRRSRLEIYFDILAVVNKGIDKPTRIMYKTNLSWMVLQDIFITLIDSGFIKEETKMNTKRYYVTDKGKNALSYHLKSMDGLSKVEEIYSK